MFPTQNLHVKGMARLITPNQLKAEFPNSEASDRTVVESRQRVLDILEQRDPRLLVVVGPCSIHDVDAALEYGSRLKTVRQECADRLEIVMRVYFEKPRTTIGWKGLINDPHLDNSQDIESGLKVARRLLLDITGMGLPAATEFLDPIIPQYIADLVTWAAIGARTTESQTHREIASGLSTPVAFKNGTNGDVGIAINAIVSASRPHSFLGLNSEGRVSVVRTVGNRYGHLVLRGGEGRPNYDTVSVTMAQQALTKAGLTPNIVVDCSHANSYKDHALQPLVMKDVVNQVRLGNTSLVGIMVESNLVEGKQTIPQDLSKLIYGCSVTDACVGWETTEEMILEAADALRDVLPGR